MAITLPRCGERYLVGDKLIHTAPTIERSSTLISSRASRTETHQATCGPPP
jgi:hypothetical protein